ncbi:MAG TPA: glycosyltransferase family 4 protein [Phycisphaerae bacterium]|nr:glycosyltransferase family 4 protein [Phycisphaerae bacterium]
MHSLFITPPNEFYSPLSGGAVATVIMETARPLLEANHEVTILAPATEDPQYPVGRVLPMHVHSRNDLHFLRRRLNALRTRLARYDWPYYHYYLREIRRLLKTLPAPPDAVTVFNDLVAPKHLRPLLPRSTKMFTWLHNEWRTRQPDIRPIDRSVDKFLTCSHYIADWTTTHYRLPRTRFAPLPNGVNLQTFHPRENFLAPSSPLKVLFLGRIDPNKGPDLAARAVAQLRAENLPLSLTVAGGLWFYNRGNESADPFFQSLQPLMQTANATYLGHVPRDKVPALVRDHDVACVLSRSNEPFGLVALEAMASGLAVIASNRGGLPEACGTAGILLNPDDFPSIVSALRTLATNPAALAEQKQKSLARAQSSPWSTVADKLLALTQQTVPAESLAPPHQIENRKSKIENPLPVEPRLSAEAPS